jgi:hypothetical protein
MCKERRRKELLSMVVQLHGDSKFRYLEGIG